MHAGAIAAHPRAALGWCYDVNPAAAAEVAASTGCQVAPSVEAVLADPAVTAVLIASATSNAAGE